MPVTDTAKEKIRQEKELRIHRLIAFASGLFQGDVTVRTLLESLAEGVVIIDKTGTILLANTRAEKIFGYPGGELVGKPHTTLIPERFRKVHEEHVAHFFDKPRIRPMGQIPDLVGLHRDGNEVPLEISLSFLETINGVLALAFMNDIASRKQLEKRLREGEELFHIQVECVKDYAIYTLDAQGFVLNWNTGVERLKGYRAEEIIGKHFSCFFTEKDRNDGKPDEELEKAATLGRFAEECWRVRKDGSGFWADIIITALRDESGSLWGFSTVTHDITERKKAEEALRFSEARYRALFEDNPTMIFTVDTEWTILSANTLGARLLGYTIEELEGQSVLKLVAEDDRAAVVEHLQECLKNLHQVCRWQFRKISKDGRLLWVEEVAQTVYDLNGAPNILIVCQDITGRKQMEAEREKLLVQLDAVMNGITEGVVISDLKGNILSMNTAALAINEFESIDQVRLQLHQYREKFELFDLEGRPVPFEQWPYTRVLRGERFTDYELSVRRKDTGKIWIGSFNGTPVQTKTGDTILGVVTLRDITERKRSEVAFSESETRFHAMFNLAAVGIAQVSLNGQWMLINQKLSDILGYSFDELGKMTLQQISHPDDLERHLAHIRRLLAGEVHAYTMEKRYFCKDGSILWVNLNVTLVRDQYGKPLYFIAIVEDINERKKAEEEIQKVHMILAEKADELEAANKELESFSYMVAHDLRDPLNFIGLSFQTIQKLYGAELDETGREYLAGGYKSVQRMGQLIDVLLEFSKLSNVEAQWEHVDISAVAREIVEELKVTSPERRCIFHIAEGITVNGDPKLLRVALNNILRNAWKFTGKREEAVIEFGATEIGGKRVYFIRDNGEGFDLADAHKLFKPFLRLPGSEQFEGSGIGLATVERIILRHGGKVWAEGEPGKGACFYFTLSGG